jgi:hypothetical protein
MARVTVDDVNGLLETDVDDTKVEVAIAGATAMVDEALGTGTTAILKEIERYLAAHLLACGAARLSAKEEAGGAKVEYVGKTGMGLDASQFGQMVKILDTTGKLATLGLKNATITAIE